MITLQVTSLSHGAGKTAVCAGLGSLLVRSGKKVSYLKTGISPTPDADTVFMQQIPGFSDAADTEIDVKLVESANEAGRIPDAKTIAVVAYSEIDQLPTIGSADGIIINKVPVSQLPAVKTKVENLKNQVPIFGILPEDKTLITFSLGELAQLIDGQITSETEMKDLPAASYMLGAMTVDSALPYFNRKTEKVAILRAERADMQMATLATDTRALVLYGETPVIPMVALRAQDKKVPVITTKLNAAAITDKMADGILKTKFNQPGKLPRFTELMSQNIDLPVMYKTLGII